MYKVEHSIYFANCKTFAENIYKLNQLRPSAHVQPSVLYQNPVVNRRRDEVQEVVEAGVVDQENEASEDEGKIERVDDETTDASFCTAESSESTHTALEQRIIGSRRPSATTGRHQASTAAAGHNVLVDVHDREHIADDFILDFSAVNYIDTNGIQVIEELVDDFKHLGAFVYICHPQESFLRIICRLNLIDKFDAHVFLTIDDAVNHFNRKHTIT